ncbi:MAG TPA: type II secretion system protein [Chthoniobacterales bacterium]|nr:type II secretion system protein [Chthoniobacterales bacterium]
MSFSASFRLRHVFGFTLVEIMVVVAIIGLVTALALPSLMKARQRTNRTRLAEQLRVLRDAFEMYAAENSGAYPPDAGPGEVPAGMAPYLGTKVKIEAPTPIGGRWDWDLDYQPRIKACISISHPNATLEEMREIDAMIDDGDLATGTFRSPRESIFSAVVEE